MVILSEAQQSRRIPRINQWVTLRDLIRSLPVRSASGHPVHGAASPAAPFSTSLGMTAPLPISILAAEEFHDIAPPVDYSLLSPWLIFVGVFVSLTVVGLIIWFVAKSFRRPTPPQPPRERTLALLEQIRAQITEISPYRFSIRVSDILRGYVTEQFGLPVTRQTSVEFLNGVRGSSPFSEDEKSLLEDFLNRCDLIKFARYEATTSDSELLLEEAIRFVKGGQPCLIGSQETVR
jgi:hypothetical protein